MVLTKGSIEGQGYGFSPKWKDNKSRGEMEKTWEKGGSLYIFERFVILYVTITPNKVLQYALNKSSQCMLCSLSDFFYSYINSILTFSWMLDGPFWTSSIFFKIYFLLKKCNKRLKNLGRLRFRCQKQVFKVSLDHIWAAFEIHLIELSYGLILIYHFRGISTWRSLGEA